MTNILVECPDLIASVKVGVLNNLQAFIDEGKCNVKFKKTLDIKNKDILWADVLIIVRGCESITLSIVQIAKNAGRFIVYFLDDDLLHVPENVSCSLYFKDKIIKKNIVDILELSDVLWYVNPLIGGLYGKYCKGRHLLTHIVAEIENSPSLQFNSDKINILYAGSIDHESLIKKYLCKAIKNISKKHKDVTFTFVGANPGIKGNLAVKHYKYFPSYEQYSDFIKEGDFHIGLAIIDTSQFYQCKYLNKFIEYTRFGIVGIYTDSLPYTMEIEHGVNGFLTKNTSKKWEEVIEYAISDRENLILCRNNAIDIAKHKFSVEEIKMQLISGLPELTEYKAPHIKRIKSGRSLSPFWALCKQRMEMLWEEHHFMAIFYIAAKAIKFIVRRTVGYGDTIVKRIFHRDL